MTPVLVPGAHLLQRGPGQHQVGLDPDRAVRVGPAGAAGIPETPDALAALVSAGQAVADDRLVRTVVPPATAAPPWHRATLAALVRRRGADAAEAATARRSWVIRVAHAGHPLSHELAGDLDDLCSRSGLLLPRDRRPGPAARTGSAPADLRVLVSVGEPDRSRLDPWVADGDPHLVVRLTEGAAVIGPFVVPGSSACVRCTDLDRSDADPAWPLLVAEHARASRSDRADGVPEPVDAALAALALAWAARDIETFVEGDVPTTWGTTVRLSSALESLETRSWRRRRDCGCDGTS